MNQPPEPICPMCGSGKNYIESLGANYGRDSHTRLSVTCVTCRQFYFWEVRTTITYEAKAVMPALEEKAS